MKQSNLATKTRQPCHHLQWTSKRCKVIKINEETRIQHIHSDEPHLNYVYVNMKNPQRIQHIHSDDPHHNYEYVTGWNHEDGLHFRDNLVSKISENQLSAELNIFFGRNIYFSAELLLGRKHKRQIERTHNRALDLREKIWSAGYFFSVIVFSAEQSFGRIIFRPKKSSAESWFI